MMDYNLEVLPRKILGVKFDNLLFIQIFVVSLSDGFENNHTTSTDYSKTLRCGTKFRKHILTTE